MGQIVVIGKLCPIHQGDTNGGEATCLKAVLVCPNCGVFDYNLNKCPHCLLPASECTVNTCGLKLEDYGQ